MTLATLPFVLLLLSIVCADPVHAADRQATQWSEFGEPTVTGVRDVAFTPGTKVQFQAGILYRFGGQRFDESSEPYLVTIGVNVPFYWDREHATWGAGFHVAFDGDGGPRVGPKLFWRNSLGSNRSGYYQFGKVGS